MSCSRRIDLLGTFVLLGLMFLSAGCSKEEKQGRFLASVKGNELFMSNVATHVDTTSAYAVRNYVSNWVDKQILFDEAKKLGLDNSPEFNQRVEEFSTQLAITLLLNRKVYDAPLEISQDDISKFYVKHKGEFLASEDIAFVNYAAFDKRSLAVSFRNALVSGTAWSAVFGDLPTYAIMDVRDSAYVTASSSIGPMWNVIQSLEPGKISFPIQVDSLSYIVQVMAKIKPGESLPVDYAAARIKQRLTIERRQTIYRALLDSLRASVNYEVDPSVAIRDTSSQE
jgi:peptidyl-prolyl cis-trans isomerase C